MRDSDISMLAGPCFIVCGSAFLITISMMIASSTSFVGGEDDSQQPSHHHFNQTMNESATPPASGVDLRLVLIIAALLSIVSGGIYYRSKSPKKSDRFFNQYVELKDGAPELPITRIPGNANSYGSV